MSVAEKLTAWIRGVQGRYINEDAAFGAQCWDLAANWSKHLGLPVIHTGGAGRWPGWAGNMVDAFPQSAAVAAAYELIGPGQPARPGDIAVWGDSYWYYPKTHVAVVVRDGGLLTCMSQNSTPSQAGNPYPQWTTGPSTIQALPKQGLIGYIRPRTGLAAQGTTTPPQEELDMSAVDEIYKFTTTLFKQYHEASITSIYGFTTTLFKQYHEASINETRAALRDAFKAYAETKAGPVDAGDLALEVARKFDAIMDAGIKAVDVPDAIDVESLPEIGK